MGRSLYHPRSISYPSCRYEVDKKEKEEREHLDGLQSIDILILLVEMEIEAVVPSESTIPSVTIHLTSYSATHAHCVKKDIDR